MKKRLIAILSIILCLTMLSGCGLVQYLQYDPKLREIITFFDKEGLYECLTHEDFAELIGEYSIDGEKLQDSGWEEETAENYVKHEVIGEHYKASSEQKKVGAQEMNINTLYFKKPLDNLNLPCNIQFGDTLDEVLAAFDLPSLQPSYLEDGYVIATILQNEEKKPQVVFQNWNNDPEQPKRDDPYVIVVEVDYVPSDNDNLIVQRNIYFHFHEETLELVGVSIIISDSLFLE